MTGNIEIEVRADAAGHDADWRDLATRADPNVFMDPVVTEAGRLTGLATLHTLAAWTSGPRRLVGLWTLAEDKAAPIGGRYLKAPHHLYAFVGGPVIDRDWTDAVVAAFFDAIRRHPALPKVARLEDIDGGSAAHTAILAALSGRRTEVLSDYKRAFATKETERKSSGSTRKKLRQHWNRLSANGTLAVENRRTEDAAKDAFETFLSMEAKTWKGAEGTALVSKEQDARFARKMFADLNAAGRASVAVLTLDGNAIATQVLLYCGTRAYTWKTAYDTAHEDYSPGALLIDKLADMLFAEGVTAIDSCALEGSFMDSLLPGRQETVAILADLGARRSPTFDLILIRAKAWDWARRTVRRLRSRGIMPAKKSPAARQSSSGASA